jgi:hypothetical protein
MESKKIAVSKRTPLSNRVSETGRGVRDWLKALDLPFDHTVDKLQLKKLERKQGQWVYHYGIIRGTPSFALEAERETSQRDAGIFEAPFTYLENSPEAIF